MTSPSTRPRTCAVAPSWAAIRSRVRSTSICRAGTCRTCSCRAQPRFRRMRATTRPARWARSPTGPPMRSARSTSRTRGRSCMPNRIALAAAGMLSGLAVVVAAGALAGPGVDPQHFPPIERGRYLAIVGDCAACHTLVGSGHDFAGGRPIETPFGTLLAPNITPDPATGIGAWTDDEFVNALTKGTGRNGTRLYPAMPYTYMTKVTRADALALRAYFNT